MSDFVGVIRGFETGEVYAIINPDDDAELDNPRHRLLQPGNGEPIEIVKIPREEYMTLTSHDDIVDAANRIAGERG